MRCRNACMGSKFAGAAARRLPVSIVLTDGRGYGCINLRQIGRGGGGVHRPELDVVTRAA